jgi:hypothetical protein
MFLIHVGEHNINAKKQKTLKHYKTIHYKKNTVLKILIKELFLFLRKCIA